MAKNIKLFTNIPKVEETKQRVCKRKRSGETTCLTWFVVGDRHTCSHRCTLATHHYKAMNVINASRPCRSIQTGGMFFNLLVHVNQHVCKYTR